MNKKISCIIPARNESLSIANTLKSVVNQGMHEIIVVDDGSSDDTAKIVESFGEVRLIKNDKNLGKSKTVARGILNSTGDFIFLLDADLKGLNFANIKSMIEPINSGFSDVVISMRENTPGWMKTIGVDLESGERIFPKGVVLPHLEGLSHLKSYGLEPFLNRIFIKNNLRIKSVLLSNVKNDMKWQKGDFIKGVRSEISMWLDIFRTVSLGEWIMQNFRLRKLLVK